MALRWYGNHSLRWSPVHWFPKGYNRTEVFMRNIMESVLTDCKNQGLYIPAVCFDGQWHTIATRSIINNLLTLRQLQTPGKRLRRNKSRKSSESLLAYTQNFSFNIWKLRYDLHQRRCTPLRVRERLWCRDEIINQWNIYQSCARRSFKL